MSEQRLIDANALREDWLENGENEYVYDTNSFLESIDNATTIFAEGLPIVQRLRSQIETLNAGIENMSENIRIVHAQRDRARNDMERVTKERDAAIRDIVSILQTQDRTYFCTYCGNKNCVIRGGKEPYNPTCNPRWRGPQNES